MTIDVDNVVGDEFVPLILLAPTGIKYTAQCGGMMCTHPEAEGFVIKLSSSFGEEINDCEHGCQYLSYNDDYGKGKRQKLAAILDLYLKNKTDGWRFKIEFDFERVDELQEGWWPVKVKGLLDEFYGTYLNHRGFIHTGNCD
jgi:hypothetical protein